MHFTWACWRSLASNFFFAMRVAGGTRFEDNAGKSALPLGSSQDEGLRCQELSRPAHTQVLSHTQLDTALQDFYGHSRRVGGVVGASGAR